MKRALVAAALALAYMRFMKRWGDGLSVEVSKFLEEVNTWTQGVHDELAEFAKNHEEQRRLDIEAMDDFVHEVTQALKKGA